MKPLTESGGSGVDNVSEQTVQTHSTDVQPEYHSTLALDWTRVGGVVQKSVGVCKTHLNDWMPVWVHPRYKPECSKKQENIFLGSDNETLSS